MARKSQKRDNDRAATQEPTKIGKKAPRHVRGGSSSAADGEGESGTAVSPEIVCTIDAVLFGSQVIFGKKEFEYGRFYAYKGAVCDPFSYFMIDEDTLTAPPGRMRAIDFEVKNVAVKPSRRYPGVFRVEAPEKGATQEEF